MTDPSPTPEPGIPTILLDTDPGGDDAVALLWLASLVHQRRAELVAVTTVDGNVGPAATWRNAAGLAALADLAAVPVGAGVRCPQARRRAARVHGEAGLGGQAGLLPTSPLSIDRATASARLIVDTLTARPGEITLLAVGPLSNLAEAERLHPGVLGLAREVIVMGGAMAEGNVTPMAEFNIHFDPPAAAACIAARPDLALVPLDLTTTLLLTHDRVRDVIRDSRDTALARLLTGLCDFMINAALARGTTGGVEGFPVHDAATVAAVFYPDTVTFRSGRLTVEAGDGPDSGRTLFDAGAGDERRARVAFDGDRSRLLDALCNDLRWLVARQTGQSE